jgi:lipopolysaccharide/colanic/teichoic acid biosynthesis glycosyltransferase
MIKRIFDVLVSLSLLIIFSSVIFLVTFLVYFSIGCPAFFKQIRPGRHGVPFEMYKFRSMSNELDDKGELKSDSARLGKFGKVLRSTSLDELPGLWNVLKGDMSLVGPRPLLLDYLPLYNDIQQRRNEIKPGITGWAQINGRNAISWDERFNLDVWYVDNQSFLLDLKILFLTLKKVIVREGISAKGQATVEPFKGNK